jgi:MFS family permease
MRRLFILVAAVVLADTMFYAAITPLLPQYAADLGLSKTAAGVLSASYAAGTLLGTFPAAWVAARLGVRTAVLSGLALMSVTGLVFAFAEDVVVLDLARFGQGVGGAFSWVGAFSWLVSASPADRRGEMIGSALAAAVFGVLLGPVVGGVATVIGPEPVFSSAAVLGAGLAVLAWGTPAPQPTSFPGWRRLARAARVPAIVAGFWLVMLPALFSGIINVLAPLRLDELGAGGVVVSVVFLVSALLEGTASPLFGRIADRRGRLWPIRIGLAAAALSALVLPLPNVVAVLGVTVVVAELTLGLCWTPAMAMLSDAAERINVGQWFAFGLVNLAWAGGQVAGSSGGGGLADATSDTVPFALAAALLGLTAAAITLAGRGEEIPARAATHAAGRRQA